MLRPRGRPKQYDADTALQAASEVFWSKGFSATSLDDLAAAMRMNRPSIYRAFGSKEAIYRQALAAFCQALDSTFEQTMLQEQDIAKALTKFYTAALAVYTSGEQAKGCLVMSTAATAATCHPDVQSDLLEIIQGLDGKLEQRFAQAQKAGQLKASCDIKGLAALAQGLLHSLSLRARAGQSQRQLKSMVRSGVAMMVG